MSGLYYIYIILLYEKFELTQQNEHSHEKFDASFPKIRIPFRIDFLLVCHNYEMKNFE